MATIKKANLNVKIDQKLKSEAESIFEDMGLTTTAAVNMFLKRVIDDRELPFKPRVTTTLDKALDDIENERIDSFETVDDWKAALKKYVQN
ncbi:type II toxin-antitoxin system RelB/DinJ family antitoxin [Leuconostoc citreum]|uniref:type II toxin-antitoxin system RelB/DinJ family antitoxin n=1 Tax=Leuconostoc citreum TaxID=33964 RepID=UPI00200B22E3|nr:type II toxin-antitoxin system RelB/DinJ family antitoxin [Leuconostoc citreum]MCK8605743.1 type II toxin-antitoxin system RelB/DinJ family antitoxin [Leuconostoc citreum]